MASNIPSRKQQGSSIMPNPHAGLSQPLQPFRRLRTRRGCAQLRSHYNQSSNASALPTRLESANEHIEDNSMSSPVDFNASREPNPIGNHGLSSSEGSWSVMNSKYELHLSESPDIHLHRAHAKISHSPRPSTSGSEHRDSQQTSIRDNSLIPDPLKVGKNSMSWDPAVEKMYQNKNNNKHSMSSAAPHSRSMATEKALRQTLFQMKAQIAELRRSLSLCESKLSQMTDELSEMKSAPDTKYESKLSQTLLDKNHKPEYPITAPDLDVTDSKQLAFLSSVAATGVSAQRKRGQKAPAI